MTRLLAIALLLVSSLAAAPTTMTTTTSPTTRPLETPRRLYFDTITGGRSVPAGFRPAIVEPGGRYANAIGREDSYYVGGYRGPNQELDLPKVRLAAARVPPDVLYVIDNETPGWSTDVRRATPDAVNVARQRYAQWSSAMRAGNPRVQLAIYDVLPRFEAYAPTYHFLAERAVAKSRAGEALTAQENWFAGHAYVATPAGWTRNDDIRDLFASRDYRAWLASNDADVAAGLDRCVDVVTPSIYFYGLGEGVEGYTAEMLAEARRLCPGKPVCPLIWPRYHDDEARQPTLDVWRAFCRQVFERADGAIFWGTNAIKDRAYLDVAREEAARAAGQ